MTVTTYLWEAQPSGYASFYVASQTAAGALELAEEHSDHDIVGIKRVAPLVVSR